MCYPRIFSATNEFREILPGQEVPPGLHIQVDMTTGQRKARLMTADGSPDESALIVVDEPDAPADGQRARDEGRQQVFGAAHHTHGDRTVELVGYVVEVGGGNVDSGAHAQLLAVLGELKELAYDPRQAERVMGDPGAVDALLRLGDPEPRPTAWPAEVRRLASIILGTMVQNNPRLQGIGHRAGAIPALLRTIQQEHDAVAAGRHLFALSSMTRGHAGALAQFAELGGLGIVQDLRPLSSLATSKEEAARLEMRIVRFVEDALNPELSPGLPDSVTRFAAGWCDSLALRLIGSTGDGASFANEHRLLYLRSLQLLRVAYPDTCRVSPSLRSWAHHELLRAVRPADGADEDFRQALADLSEA
ncbi:nucleotide exchange factor sil1 [Coemansia biformis]|uniref:Nucleotide exchange factor sil1 n=1 Tax=Coemansia biformis TaxID=1286918 RepID=A0A9W7YCS8_9FUNG|nr:nucleotide exchange factor sil1 [Coemansia biformis]